jgi:16S rRNA (cytosine1402-N4)-methyltransferase
LAVVSFHSLEDRIVKRFLASRGQHASRPSRHRPVIDGPAPSFEILSRKAILPIEDERNQNSRARSAKLRIARRTDAPPLGMAVAPYSTANQAIRSQKESKQCG